MRRPSFAHKLIGTRSIPIHFVLCKDAQGRDCYFFLMCAQHKMGLLKTAGNKNLNLEDYGKVIASGFGSLPPQTVKDMLRKDYNFDADA